MLKFLIAMGFFLVACFTVLGLAYLANMLLMRKYVKPTISNKRKHEYY